LAASNRSDQEVAASYVFNQRPDVDCLKVLYPLFAILLNQITAGVAMSLVSAPVIANCCAIMVTSVPNF
jgi:hypothetical protein